ncbi:MAG: hypothetical protein IEMM0008_0832 [bacterium]|nr:MAG: hypothetical protein IEMM0008_0832 [bacterium]
MNADHRFFTKSRLISLPQLYRDSYEAMHLAKGHIFIIFLALFVLSVSFFKETSALFRIRWEIILPITFLVLTLYISLLYIYQKFGFSSKTFQTFDFISKIAFVICIATIIYFTKDPRTAWWVPFFVFIVLISQLSDFHWLYFLTLAFCPALVGILFIFDPGLSTGGPTGLSLFHRSFPLFIAIVAPVLYYFQCRLRHNELLIKTNNIQLITELNDLKITLERERISRDLHDSLGASLTGNILYSEIAREELHKNPEKVGEILEQIESLSRDALVKMREAVYSIMEDKEVLQNFSKYIYQKSLDILKLKDIAFRCNSSKMIDPKLSSKVKFNLYRIIGEWLTNILRHSNATKVDLSFALEDNRVLIIIQDNGKGFNRKKGLSNGSGLKNIQHRVSDIGGEVSISSEPGEGSILKITLPL